MKRFSCIGKGSKALLVLNMCFILAACSETSHNNQSSDDVNMDISTSSIEASSVEEEIMGDDKENKDMEKSDSEIQSAEINVEKIENIPEDFIFGADVSSYLAEYQSGVKFYDFDGNELDEQGFFDLLYQSGVNCARLRLWNDPEDIDGRTYGGGNNDIETDTKLGLLATGAGMGVMVDFHYSDFWADPGKQMLPKYWVGMTIDEKADSIYDFTKESLKTMLDAGVNVTYVQVGNETNSYMCGDKNWDRITKMMSAGSRAVREISEEYGRDIQIILHFANPETEGRYEEYARQLDNYGVDYDIFASSYYPIWHGSCENLTAVLKHVADTYGKKVMVAETEYAYTFADGDGSGNTLSSNNKSQNYNYDISIQGQADEMSDVINAVLNVGEAGIGVCYWEPAWIPVQVWEEDAENADEIYEQNKEIWEEFGSGWATSFAGEYDPEDAGQYYGGSAVDNMAWFDFTGHPMDILNIYNYVKTGAYTEEIAHNELEDLEAEQEAEKHDNLLTNGDFESGDFTGWSVEGTGADVEVEGTNNRGSGNALHFWAANAFAFTAEQTITLDKGTYTFETWLQGGDAGNDSTFNIYVKIGDIVIEQDGSVSTWQNWSQIQIPDIEITEDGTEVTVGLCVDAIGGAWGSFDDTCLYIQE
ncbi:MAG: glycosyl hydrolase 53 family protein [Butyrivibrio sp.]|nr:glycosyl hydrolase 53 family protein [Butyrivibrio sp.]